MNSEEARTALRATRVVIQEYITNWRGSPNALDNLRQWVKTDRRLSAMNRYGVRTIVIGHVRWMCDEALSFTDPIKMWTWVGFAQGALWAAGIASIDRFRVINKAAKGEGS